MHLVAGTACTLESALVEAKEKNWLVVDMKTDLKRIFAFE